MDLRPASKLALSQLCFALLAIGFAVCATPAHAEFDEQKSQQSVTSAVDIDLYKRDYADLNKLAERYRLTDARTPSGAPLLAFFYRGVVQYGRGVAITADGKSSDAKWDSVIAVMKDWLAKAPSPAADISLARLFIEWGAEHRGEDLASKVDPKQWAPFHERMQMAAAILAHYKAEANIDPEWYRAMLIVAVNEGWDVKARAGLFGEAVSKFPYYREIYYEMGNASQPKWGGSWEEFDAFAKAASKETARNDGASLYALLYWRMEPTCGCLMLDDSVLKWQTLKGSFADLIARYPSQWNISGYAYFACMAKDKSTMRALISQMHEFSAETWDSRIDFHDRCVKWALDDRNTKAPTIGP